MEYCSINEAWGKNRISNQYNKNIEHFKPNDDDLNLYSLNSENNKTPENRLTYKKNFKKNKRKYSSITTDGSDKHITNLQVSQLLSPGVILQYHAIPRSWTNKRREGQL